MEYKCCVPGCTSNYNSAGKEGKCSTFGFPQDPVLRQKWLHHIPIDFIQFIQNILRKKIYPLTISIQILMVLHIGLVK